MRISYLRTSYRNAGNGPVSEWRVFRPEPVPLLLPKANELGVPVEFAPDDVTATSQD